MYGQAGERREKALTDAGSALAAAYTRAARTDEAKLKQAALDSGATEEEAVRRAEEESAPSFTWLRERLGEVQGAVGGFKTEASRDTTAYQERMREAGSQATDLVREWSYERLGTARGWWQRFLDLFTGWGEQARAESEAWEAARNQEARDGLARDLEIMGAIRDLEARGIDARALQGERA